jgi:hypothetical protein
MESVCSLWRLTHRRIILEMNSYLNFKTYSIIFINGLDRIVWWRIHGMCECDKRYKIGWMGLEIDLGMDGVWMKDTWTMGAWFQNIDPETWHFSSLMLPTHQNPHWATSIYNTSLKQSWGQEIGIPHPIEILFHISKCVTTH